MRKTIRKPKPIPTKPRRYNPEDELHNKIILELEESITKLPNNIQRLQYLTTSQALIIKRSIKQVNEIIDFAYKNRIGKRDF